MEVVWSFPGLATMENVLVSSIKCLFVLIRGSLRNFIHQTDKQKGGEKKHDEGIKKVVGRVFYESDRDPHPPHFYPFLAFHAIGKFASKPRNPRNRCPPHRTAARPRRTGGTAWCSRGCPWGLGWVLGPAPSLPTHSVPQTIGPLPTRGSRFVSD